MVVKLAEELEKKLENSINKVTRMFRN